MPTTPTGTTGARINPIRFTPTVAQTVIDPSSTSRVSSGLSETAGVPRLNGELHLTVAPEALQNVINARQNATTQVYRTLNSMHGDLVDFFPKLHDTFPTAVSGILLNPDGTPAQRVSVTASAPTYETDENVQNVGWATPSDVTDARGGFRLNLPSVPAPRKGLNLQVKGGSGQTEVNIKRVMVLEGQLGIIPLPVPITPVETSIVSQLKGIQSDITPTSADDVALHPDDFAMHSPKMCLGEDECARYFCSNSGAIDCFRYSVLIRLIEPQLNHWEPVFRLQSGGGGFTPFVVPSISNSFWNSTSTNNAVAHLNGLGSLTLTNRYPVSEPIDVTQFRKAIEEDPVLLPKASTLGLGYIVGMEQVWIPAGLSLGDLLYSLPLAPGEQQRIAVEERTQTASFREVQSFSEEEFQTFNETQNSSADAVFHSAFNEATNGGSSMNSSSSTSSVGATASTGIIGAIFGGGGVSGGYSNSSSSGNSNSWQNTSRDFASNASQDFHAALGRVAAATRRSTQATVRTATESERQSVSTKIITNHNHGHALTMQYWEVLRHFSVTSEVDDCQLVCFIPLELVQFLPPGQGLTLSGIFGRSDLLYRYEMVIRYWDVLNPFFARNAEYSYGMRLLKNFAANPNEQPQPSTGLQQDIINFSIVGSFLPFEEIFVTLISRTGVRVGPIKVNHQPSGQEWDVPPATYSTSDEVMEHLRTRRLNDAQTTMACQIVLPTSIARSDIARFDITRRFTGFTYKLQQPAFNGQNLAEILAYTAASTVSYSPQDLERKLGGPILFGARATIPAPVSNPPQNPLPNPIDLLSSSSYESGEQMGTSIALAAVRVPPILAFTDLLRIEAVFQHIVRNTVTYSKAVWAALTAEERAILLERFTIGVPEGGVMSADQEVPLLNCVSNQVLGFFGNAAIMPFSIPPTVAASMKVTSRDIQDALLKFHRQAFHPCRSSITLPARGTLGEAVLGCCSSAEKIDITRFWNWQDSPPDQADALSSSMFQPSSALNAVSGATSQAPGSIISINNGAPGMTNPNLGSGLTSGAPNIGAFNDITGLTTLQKQMEADTKSAGDGRQQALDSVTKIQTQAMQSATDMVKSIGDTVSKVLGPNSAVTGLLSKAMDAGGNGSGGGTLSTLESALPLVMAAIA